MKILFAYFHHSSQLSVIQQGLISAFKKCGHRVVTCGRVIQHDMKLDYKYKEPSVSILKLLEKESKTDMVFVCWPSGNFWVSDIEKSPVPTAVYAVDTQLPLVGMWLHGYVKLFDYIFCAQKDFAVLLRREGVERVHWLPHAVDSSTQRNLHLPKIYGVSFVGTTNFLHNPRRSIYLIILKIIFNIYIATAFNEEMVRLYSQSKIVFNVSVTDDLNARVFEVLGTGSLLVTPGYQQGLLDLFKPGVSLITYNSIFSAIRQIRFYLKHSVDRQRIGHNGEKLVHKKHAYENRVRFITRVMARPSHSKRLYTKKDYKDILYSLVILGKPNSRAVWKNHFYKHWSFFSSDADYHFRTTFLANPKLFRLYSKLISRISAIRVIFWQLTHF